MPLLEADKTVKLMDTELIGTNNFWIRYLFRQYVQTACSRSSGFYHSVLVCTLYNVADSGNGAL